MCFNFSYFVCNLFYLKNFYTNLYWAERRNEKLSMNLRNQIKIGDLIKVRNFSRTKLQPYFVGPFKVIKIKFNTVTLEDPTTGEQLKRNVHLKNIIKYKSSLG